MDGQQKNEKYKIRLGEFLTIIFTFGIFATSVVAAFIFCYQLGAMKGQLKEMESGSKDTHTLAEAAKVQADAAKTAAEAALKTAEATQQMAKKADESIKATRDSMRLDQRAWVGLVQVLPSQLKDGDKIVYIKGGTVSNFGVKIKNVGKTPAIRTTTKIQADFFPKEVKFVPNYRLGESAPLSTSVIIPNMEMELKTGPTKEIPKQVIDAVKQGTLILRLYGEILYYDVFDKLHHSTFCAYLEKDLSSWATCDTYNDAN